MEEKKTLEILWKSSAAALEDTKNNDNVRVVFGALFLHCNADTGFHRL